MPLNDVMALEGRGPSLGSHDFWPWMPAPANPPVSLATALGTPLRSLAGCWIEGTCPGCGTGRTDPLRVLLREQPVRADMPLCQAVTPLIQCDHCARWGRRLALVSNPGWRTGKQPSGSANWSLTLNGADAGALDFTEPWWL